MNSEINEKLAIEECLNFNGGSIGEDVELLLYALKESYAGSIGLDTSDFEELLNQVSLLREEKDKETLYVLLKEAFSKVKDNHLKIWRTHAERSIGSVSPKSYEAG